MPPKRKSKKGKKSKNTDVKLEEEKFKRSQKEIVLVKDRLGMLWFYIHIYCKTLHIHYFTF